MECEVPILNSNSKELEAILRSAKTIAIIGLSPNPAKDSNKVALYLQNAGYKIVPVYPKEETILGEKVYRSILDIPFSIDIVDIFRKPAVIAQVVDASIKKGDCKVIWTQLGLVNNEAAQKAKDAGMQVVQNYCTKIEHSRMQGNS